MKSCLPWEVGGNTCSAPCKLIFIKAGGIYMCSCSACLPRAFSCSPGKRCASARQFRISASAQWYFIIKYSPDEFQINLVQLELSITRSFSFCQFYLYTFYLQVCQRRFCRCDGHVSKHYLWRDSLKCHMLTPDGCFLLLGQLKYCSLIHVVH